MNNIKITLNVMVPVQTLNEIALRTTDFESFLKDIKHLSIDQYSITYDVIHKKRIKRFYDTSSPVKLRRFILTRMGSNPYYILPHKIYAGVYTITGFIRADDNLYLKIEMPEDTAISFHDLQLSADQWTFFFGQVKHIFPL